MKRPTSIFGIGTTDVRKHALVASGRTKLVAVFFSVLLVSYILPVMNTWSVAAQLPKHDAVFENIIVTNGIVAKDLMYGGTAKIYYNQNPVYANISLFNFNCSMACGSNFTIQVVQAGHSWWSESFRVAERSSGKIVYDLCRLFCPTCPSGTIESIWSLGANLSQPFVFTFRLWYNPYCELVPVRVLEEEKSITLEVFSEFVAFSQGQCKVEKAKTGSVEISVSNLDDEKISDLNLTIGDSGVFEVSPNIREMGDFEGSEEKTTTFDVKAPETIVMGTYNITVNFTYQDILERVHFESKAVTITVEPETQGSFPYLIVFSVTAVAVAGAGGFLFFRMKRNAQSKNKQQGKHRNSILTFGTVLSVWGASTGDRKRLCTLHRL